MPEKQMTNLHLQISKHVSSEFYKMENSRFRRASSVDLDKMAHCELPYLDLCCLQIRTQ